MTRCKDIIPQFLGNAARNPGRVIKCTLSSNQSDGIVSYATGLLTAIPGSDDNPATDQGELPTLARLEGELEQLFSDRTEDVTQPGSSVQAISRAFSPRRVDRLRLSISPEKFNPEKLRVTVTLLSWENTQFSFLVDCVGNVLFGIGDPVGFGAQQAFYTISLRP